MMFKKRNNNAGMYPHQFQPSEFSAATGAEMKAVRPEVFMLLLPVLPWLSRPPLETAP